MEREIETYLYEYIPITKAMGIRVEYASADKVVLFAPFAPNINHKNTVFGGSLHTVATLACWCLLHIRLKGISNNRVQIVITESHVAYPAPVDADFKAECSAPDQVAWKRFVKMLHLKGKARIPLTATIYHRDRLCVDYKATFAAIRV